VHPDEYEPLKAAMNACLRGLEELGLFGTDNQLPSSELWNAAGHLLSRGWLQNRARSKPRGYAGDHELLARIYQQRLCEDPLGQLFDRYFQEQAAPQAVRHRMAMMRDWLVAAARARQDAPDLPPLHVAVVGSAFGLEIRAALGQLSDSERRRLRATLLDVDPAALEYASQQLCSLLRPERLVARAVNLFRLPDRPRDAALLTACDLLFCPGLLDYLNDAAAARMIAALVDQLAPGGRLIVFQFAPHNPTRAYMEWFGNWYLTYRDAEHLRQVVASAAAPKASIELGAEPLGIDLCATIARSFG
jgi:SAM-dependent methyltransferase